MAQKRWQPPKKDRSLQRPQDVQSLAEHDNISHVLAVEQEAPPGFEPGMADLQSAALATWLRRRQLPQNLRNCFPMVKSSPAAKQRSFPPRASRTLFTVLSPRW